MQCIFTGRIRRLAWAGNAEGVLDELLLYPELAHLVRSGIAVDAVEGFMEVAG